FDLRLHCYTVSLVSSDTDASHGFCGFHSWFDHTRILHSFPTRRSSDLESTEAKPEDEAKKAKEQKAAEKKRLAVCVCLVFSLKRSEEHTSELQSRFDLVCRLLLEKKKHPYTVVTKEQTRDRRNELERQQ